MRWNDAKPLQKEVETHGTVVVYRNNIDAIDYAISPAFNGQKRFAFTMVFGLGATIVTLVSLAILWRYLRVRIDNSAGLRHRFHMESDGEALAEAIQSI